MSTLKVTSLLKKALGTAVFSLAVLLLIIIAIPASVLLVPAIIVWKAADFLLSHLE